jgi:TupA-like ATPgrasp
VLEVLGGRMAFHLQKARIARMFQQHLGYAGNFENPKSYEEKIQYRKLYGNHAFYASVADKYRVRAYVAERVGDKYLVPLLGAYDRLDAAIFAKLPNEFVIKANHGCKWNKIVSDKKQLDVDATVRYFNKLCRQRFGWVAGERHYNFILPRIVIEQLLHDADSGLPWDHNFFCYHSAAGFDYSLAIRSPDGNAAIFDKDWKVLESQIPEAALTAHLRPESFGEMLEVARRLSADFDFVRVDLYSVAGRVYFGELTCTPGQGFTKIESQTRQRMRDEMWHLDANNPLLYCHPETRQSCAGEWRSLAAGLGARRRAF